jgi:anti-anti-sigma factor
MADFELSGGVLKVNRDLHQEMEEEFKEKVQQLLGSGSAELVLDLTGVNYMRSYHLSILVALHLDAQERGKSLRIVASQKIADLAEMAGLSELLKVERAPQGRRPAKDRA